ncbi:MULTISPECIES: hypothetical protein [Enterococcus]|uniref:NfeD-like C-terminal domain-containing protein n=1 Tax=Enterococcus gallinarum TaxID=1353 RepID=A0A6I4XM85_ENTGA|nr:hypothetical protein [Enterococcus gallinarum]MBS5959447.1 hypothetical protein [Enterococcus gallinarum]MCC2752337.1 hypothetical protein [Enterococcus gallinarum]MCD4986248.1 hypothetical protein [Enterococcus gallinarum]MCD5075943.1 hypothetical protein [Enterococcus gallinarum]MDL4906433.1 hypothetical protein [Enterococcus gallinarum]
MVIGEWVTLLQEYLQQFPSYIQIVGWLIVLFVLIFAVFLLFSLLLGPFMWLFNRLTDKNRSNVLGHEDFLIGELTEKIVGNTLGEVMEIGSKTARSVYPAKFYKEEDIREKRELPVGTKVIIVDFDKKGIALVVENRNFIE